MWYTDWLKRTQQHFIHWRKPTSANWWFSIRWWSDICTFVGREFRKLNFVKYKRKQSRHRQASAYQYYDLYLHSAARSFDTRIPLSRWFNDNRNLCKILFISNFKSIPIASLLKLHTKSKLFDLYDSVFGYFFSRLWGLTWILSAKLLFCYSWFVQYNKYFSHFRDFVSFSD